MQQSDKSLLQGIVEMDECYVGGKPRKGNKRDDDTEGGNKSKRGRGTDKMSVIGAVERGSNVVACHIDKKQVNLKGLQAFVKKHVDNHGTLLIMDEYKAYKGIANKIKHATINHSMIYVEGLLHINTIEGFWSGVKRAWYGQHHHYSKEYANMYITEACFKYNKRSIPAQQGFDGFLRSLFA